MQGTGSLIIYVGQIVLLRAEGSLTASDSAGGQAKLSGTSSFYTSGVSEFASGVLLSPSNLFIEPSTLPRGLAWLHEVTSIGGDINYAISRQLLQPLYSYSNDEYVPAMPDYGIAWVTQLASWGFAEGAAGEGVANIPTLVSRSGDYSYSIGSAVLPYFVSLGVFGDDHEATVYEYVKAWDGFGAQSDAVVLIFESPILTHSSSAGRLAYDEFVSSGAIDGSTTSTASRIVTVYNTGEVTEFYAGDRLAQEQFIQDVVAAGGINPATIFNVTVDNALQVDGAIDALMSLLQALEEQAVVDGTYSTLHDLLVEFFSYPSINDTSLPVKNSGGIWEIPGISDGRTWAVNLDTGASSQYDGYGFNSFFERDGEYYGVAEDGIYLLEGDTDAGAGIPALLEIGSSNYGIHKTKKSNGVVVGCSSTGVMYLKIDVDGVEQIYQMTNSSAHIESHLIPISHRQIGTQWNLTLMNDGSCDFDIADIEFRLLAMTRRTN